MRIINADEALRMIRNSKQDCPYYRSSYEEIWREAHDCAISCVEAAPTIDAEPVKHGKWAQVRKGVFGVAVCSNCKCDGFIEYNFCPNCGADMRERKET